MLRMMTLEPTGNVNAGGTVEASVRPVSQFEGFSMFLGRMDSVLTTCAPYVHPVGRG